MIVLSERVARAAGLDLDTAVALLKPPADELVVRIRNVHEPRRIAAPAMPQADLDDPPPHRSSEGVSLRSITSAPDLTSDARAVSTATGPSNVLGLPRLQRGCSLGDAQAVAHALRAQLEPVETGGYRITSAFGGGSYPSLDAVMDALNARSFGGASA